MSERLCRWCQKTLAEHRGEDAPMVRMPCGGRKSGFVPVAEAKSPPDAPVIFGKAMAATGSDSKYFELAIGPFRLGVMPAVGSNKEKSYWFIEGVARHGDLLSGYAADHAVAACEIEQALTGIETAIRQARGA